MTKQQYSKVFDTSTIKGLEQAERFKAFLENKGLAVTTVPCGLYRVRITGDEAKESN